MPSVFSVVGQGSRRAKARASLAAFWSAMVFCVVLCPSTEGLTNGEKAALTAILNSFPVLGSIPWFQPAMDGQIDYGRAWTSNFDTLCLGSDRYEYYGLYCGGGHISGIVLSKSWVGTQNVGTSVSGLSFLTNITVLRGANSAALNFSKVLVGALPIQRVDAVSVVFNTSDFSYPGAVTDLAIDFPLSFRVAPFVNLRSFTFQKTQVQVFDFGAWPSTLETVVARGVSLTEFVSFALPTLSRIRHLELLIDQYLTARADTTSVQLESDTLQYFKFGYTSTSQTFGVSFNFSSLVEADLDFPIIHQSMNLTAPNLRKYSLNNFDIDQNPFTSHTKLEDLRLISLGIGTVLPSFSFAPNLSSIEIVRWPGSQLELGATICDIVANCPRLSHLVLDNIGTGPLFISGCLSTTSLKYLSLVQDSPLARSRQAPSGLYNPVTFLTNLPQTIETLLVSAGFYSDLNITSLTKFGQLKELRLGYGDPRLVGDMRDDFLLSFPQLHTLVVIGSNVKGAIPSVGWANLRLVQLRTGQETWAGIDSAPLLVYLLIYSASLPSLPSDANMPQLPALEELQLDTNTTSTGIPFPTFWTRLPQLTSVSLIGNFLGPITSAIAAPRLTSIYLNSGSMCGPLPDFEIPTALSLFGVDRSNFSGTIPASWETNLIIYGRISLASNQLTGTIPKSLFENPYIYSINLANNYFSGPLWNLSQYYPAVSLTLSNNNFNICASDPGIPLGGTIASCQFVNTSTCPSEVNGCVNYWQACNTMTCQSQATARIPPLPSCVVLPPPVAPPQCPLPGPSGFTCINGQWTSTGSVTAPSIPLPPNVGIVLITGNLTANGSLTFSGVGTTIEVQGCIENLPTEVIIILDGDEKLPATTLLTQKGANCGTDLRLVPVNLIQNKKSCKTTKASTSSSTHASLIVLFDVDSGQCNVKWIILGCGLGGFVLLLALSTAILYHKSYSCRSMVRSCNPKKANLPATGSFITSN